MLGYGVVVRIINREQYAQLQSAWWQLSHPRMGRWDSMVSTFVTLAYYK